MIQREFCHQKIIGVLDVYFYAEFSNTQLDMFYHLQFFYDNCF